MNRSLYKQAKEAFVDRVIAKDFVKLDTNIQVLQKLKDFYNKSFKILVLYGEPGAGKTMLLHKFISEIDGDNTLFFKHPPSDQHTFEKQIIQVIFKKSDGPLLELLEEHKVPTPTTLIIDESQLLSPELLEYMRILSDTQKLRFILSFHYLKSGELITEAHFETRIAQKIHLPLPTSSELAIYIQKRLFNYEVLQIANLFTKKEVSFIHTYTKGNLRKTHRFLYTLFDIMHYFEENRPSEINTSKLERKFLEMTAIELGYIDA